MKDRRNYQEQTPISEWNEPECKMRIIASIIPSETVSRKMPIRDRFQLEK